MLQNLQHLTGKKLSATDGEIGTIKDVYFDDHSWVIRYLVADTGSWLVGRLTLLSPHALGAFNQITGELPVALTRTQIEHSPNIDQHQPISRQHEMSYFGYYGWPAYWEGSSLWGPSNYPLVLDATAWGSAALARHQRHREDRHLQSARDLMGYSIHTVDGVIGTLCDLYFDDTQWVVRELIVETGSWYAGKKIRLLPEHIQRIRYTDSVVVVKLTKKDLLGTQHGELVRHAE